MDSSASNQEIDAGRGYEALFVPALFAPWTQNVINAAGVQPGAQVLDVACGTGVLARAALARVGSGGRVVGADPAPGMLAVAREREPAIEWLQCNAESLPLASEQFDHVVSQFGMMFFSDRRRAAAEMFRVLKPAGTLSIAVWRSVEHNPAYADVMSLLHARVGAEAADAVGAPFNLGDAQEVIALLADCGFVEIRAEARIEQARFASVRQMVEAELRGWLPLYGIQLDEEQINGVLLEADERLAKYAAPSGKAVFPTSAHIFTAHKA